MMKEGEEALPEADRRALRPAGCAPSVLTRRRADRPGADATVSLGLIGQDTSGTGGVSRGLIPSSKSVSESCHRGPRTMDDPGRATG